ncbi:hypothetical protein K439DRAFT_1292419, partial [Ramaria rubella]
PFANEMEWKLAKWAKDTQQGENALTKLLTVPRVATHLGLTYTNACALNQVIDHELPDFPGWRKVPIQMQGSQEVFYLYHRDVLECLHALWTNPSLAMNLMYAPQKQF